MFEILRQKKEKWGNEMLGGSVYIALIRFAVSLAGTILLFSLLSGSRFGRRKTVVCYSCFSAALVMMACIWYVADRESCARMSALVMYLCFAVFAVIMSRDSVYLTVYKLALVFYLLAAFLIGGLAISILFFDGNVWVDIIARILLIGLIAVLLYHGAGKALKNFGDYVESDADKFGVVVLIVCILFGIGYILNPVLNMEITPQRIYQILMNFFLTGILQILAFRFYLHVGREKTYERENQLIQMNYRFLEQQMEVLEESVECGKRLRHDIRHHNTVIAECARRGQTEELLQYLQEYDRETDQGVQEAICANVAVNNMLSVYTRKAENEQIKVTLDVELAKEPEIPSIDLVAILANAYENAIHACMEVKKYMEGRECFIDLMLKKKKNKLIISCSNTCREETAPKDGKPESKFTGSVGVSSIIRTAKKYNGEYDFKNENGVFMFRLIMSAEPESTEMKQMSLS